ncbi:MAG: GNAT family N-acetyltransferase [Theionarchaea archaeon]|nr:GNAT family N-acetyltransferase [Theionarchaea archaeon]MBU7001321.1 GNAT family N-acetyltransferase [Theionarchaea archaeon]MBU7019812.1 GNAT family N-acetyltransferase [Theionarchaea archaeon]MBU7035149.1 GNAT family N-acetyltransferase [Theionarchaea archaeon]MBU7040764.1 GNAT family N-acetyltransferase [Theionarchaea archaeon]
MEVRGLRVQEQPQWAEYCQKEWEHGDVCAPVSEIDMNKPVPDGTERTYWVVEENDNVQAGFTTRIAPGKRSCFLGDTYWLDLWIATPYRGKIEDELLQECETVLAQKGVTRITTRIADFNSRFVVLFKEKGYQELYKEDTFIREGSLPITELMLGYYKKTKEKVDLRISKNLREDIKTYTALVNEISAEIPNMSQIHEEHLDSVMYQGQRHMIGVWIFAEVKEVPAGFIGALISFQKVFNKNRVVGRVLNNGVLKEFRGMGIGSALYVEMLQEMRKWNAEYILDYMVMEDNLPERTLLKELGFVPAQKHVKIQKVI